MVPDAPPTSPFEKSNTGTDPSQLSKQRCSEVLILPSHDEAQLFYYFDLNLHVARDGSSGNAQIV